MAIVPVSIYKSYILWENWANEKVPVYISYSVHPVFNLQGWIILAVLKTGLDWEGERLFKSLRVCTYWNMGGSESSTVCKFLHIKKQCKLIRTSEGFLQKLVQRKAYSQYNLKELHNKTLFSCTLKVDCLQLLSWF